MFFCGSALTNFLKVPSLSALQRLFCYFQAQGGAEQGQKKGVQVAELGEERRQEEEEEAEEGAAAAEAPPLQVLLLGGRREEQIQEVITRWFWIDDLGRE